MDKIQSQNFAPQSVQNSPKTESKPATAPQTATEEDNGGSSKLLLALGGLAALGGGAYLIMRKKPDEAKKALQNAGDAAKKLTKSEHEQELKNLTHDISQNHLGAIKPKNKYIQVAAPKTEEARAFAQHLAGANEAEFVELATEGRTPEEILFELEKLALNSIQPKGQPPKKVMAFIDKPDLYDVMQNAQITEAQSKELLPLKAQKYLTEDEHTLFTSLFGKETKTEAEQKQILGLTDKINTSAATSDDGLTLINSIPASRAQNQAPLIFTKNAQIPPHIEGAIKLRDLVHPASSHTVMHHMQSESLPASMHIISPNSEEARDFAENFAKAKGADFIEIPTEGLTPQDARMAFERAKIEHLLQAEGGFVSKDFVAFVKDPKVAETSVYDLLPEQMNELNILRAQKVLSQEEASEFKTLAKLATQTEEQRLRHNNLTYKIEESLPFENSATLSYATDKPSNFTASGEFIYTKNAQIPAPKTPTAEELAAFTGKVDKDSALTLPYIQEAFAESQITNSKHTPAIITRGDADAIITPLSGLLGLKKLPPLKYEQNEKVGENLCNAIGEAIGQHAETFDTTGERAFLHIGDLSEHFDKIKSQTQSYNSFTEDAQRLQHLIYNAEQRGVHISYGISDPEAVPRSFHHGFELHDKNVPLPEIAQRLPVTDDVAKSLVTPLNLDQAAKDKLLGLKDIYNASLAENATQEVPKMTIFRPVQGEDADRVFDAAAALTQHSTIELPPMPADEAHCGFRIFSDIAYGHYKKTGEPVLMHVKINENTPQEIIHELKVNALRNDTRYFITADDAAIQAHGLDKLGTVI